MHLFEGALSKYYFYYFFNGTLQDNTQVMDCVQRDAAVFPKRVQCTRTYTILVDQLILGDSLFFQRFP